MSTAVNPVPAPRRTPVLITPLLVMLAGLAGVAWAMSEALVLSQTVSEARTVADMAENVGRWASQYGGVHVRTLGTAAKIPGSYLTRSVYAGNESDSAVLRGARTAASDTERQAMQRIEAYHWKNPALVQREVADVIATSGSKARYRMTARTVLNRNNAPSAFEIEALDALQAAGGATKEYWTVRSDQLLYARAVVAQKSCLNCHTSPETAPEFIRTNDQFNGGGGYGYQEGKPAGLISVAVPVPHTWQALMGALPAKVWAGLAVVLAGAVWLLAGLVRARATHRPVPGPA